MYRRQRNVFSLFEHQLKRGSFDMFDLFQSFQQS